MITEMFYDIFLERRQVPCAQEVSGVNTSTFSDTYQQKLALQPQKEGATGHGLNCCNLRVVTPVKTKRPEILSMSYKKSNEVACF